MVKLVILHAGVRLFLPRAVGHVPCVTAVSLHPVGHNGLVLTIVLRSIGRNIIVCLSLGMINVVRDTISAAPVRESFRLTVLDHVTCMIVMSGSVIFARFQLMSQ